VTPAELCFLSHRLAWQAIVDQNSRWGVVLEDDVVLSGDFARLLADMSWAPHDADLVRLEACTRWVKLYRRQAGEVLGRHIYKLRGSMFGSAGYAISRTACEMLLLESASGVDLAPDNFLFSPASPVFGRLTTYVLIPAPVIQQSFLPSAMIDGQPFESMVSATRVASRQAKKRPLDSIRLGVRKALKAMVQPHLFYRQIDWA
jgi:glycosyl transferase family 25